MNAVISGRAGLALIIEGETLMSLDVDDLETLVARSPYDLRFLLTDATDLVTLENTGCEEISRRLDLEHDIACALDMTLIALDSDSSMELRSEAVAALDELLTDARVIERLEFTMYATPLPDAADLKGALFSTEVKTAAARSFFERLDRDQTAISAVREAWDALPDHLFGDEPVAKDVFQDAVCNEGLFRLLALSYGDQAKVSAFLLDSLKNESLRSLRNYRDVVQQWSAPIWAAAGTGTPVIRKRVLLVDDHTLARAGIRALVEKLPEVNVIGEAKDGREALRMVRKHKPDLVLMDIAMPGLNGLEATARISKEFPNVRVIILAMYANEEYVREAIHAGAVGYLVKRNAAPELEKAIKAVAGGDSYFSSLVFHHISTVGSGHSDRAWIERLTPRQREILQLIAERHTTKDIAVILNISIKTVETHRAQLMDRLGTHDVLGLMRFAIRAGMVSLEE